VNQVLDKALLSQALDDEKVINIAQEAFKDLDQMTSAVFRLSSSHDFVEVVAKLAMARRAKDMSGANMFAAEIMWSVEDSVFNHIRKGLGK